MARRQELGTQPATIEGDSRDLKSHGSLDADIIIANAPDPVFVSDLEGKILQANDAVSALLGFRPDELIEQSLSRFITPDETREFTAALREVVERGVMRNVVLNPRSARDRKSTRLNSSHGYISYAVFCLKKKKNKVSKRKTDVEQEQHH